MYNSYYNSDGMPPGTVPHHYVNYYVSLHPNPDVVKIKKAKPFRERKSPYAETISDMKRPFDHPRDLPPRNLDWCFSLSGRERPVIKEGPV
eukprot:1494577-Amphidinium_carterae.1